MRDVCLLGTFHSRAASFAQVRLGWQLTGRSDSVPSRLDVKQMDATLHLNTEVGPASQHAVHLWGQVASAQLHRGSFGFQWET